MPGCAAVNYSNHSNKGCRLFIFPKDPKRRTTWLQNCRRDKWIPTNDSRLCEHHFEPSQFEQKRADGLRKLKPNAVPTVFSVPNPPPRITINRKERIVVQTELPTASTSRTEDVDLLPKLTISDEGNDTQVFTELEKTKRALWRTQKQLRVLEQRVKHSHEMLRKVPFLSEELIEHLSSGRRIGPWAPSLIKKALQIRFAVGWKGYKYITFISTDTFKNATIIQT